MSKRQVVHLHTHSEYSVFDGCGKQDKFLQKAVDMGNPAIAFTEHGSMRGCYKLDENVNNLEGAKLKPIHGVEFYVCDDMSTRGLTEEQEAVVDAQLKEKGLKGRKDRSEAIYQEEVRLGLRGRFHITALAKTQEGLKNLFRMSSLAWMKGYYKRPRIDLATLEKYREGVIVLSGCMSGLINTKLIDGDTAGAIELAEKMVEWFGDDFYLEVMAHPFKDQRECNKKLIKLSQSLGIKLVATQDAHWIDPNDKEAQECLLCINTNDVLSNPDRFQFGTPGTDEGMGFWLKTRDELEETFRVDHGYFPEHLVKASLDETLAIAEKCQAELKLDRKKAMIPSIEIPPEFGTGVESDYKYMFHLAMKGWDWRQIERRAQMNAPKYGKSTAQMLDTYKQRLMKEFRQIKSQGVGRYFLVIWDMYNWARANGVECGPGRGSAGGCLLSYLLGITNIDPLEHGLIFERFLAPGRIDLPDIDCDFEARRRGEIVDYLKGRYGHDKTAQIATVTTLKGKAVLRKISTVLEIPRAEVDEVTNSIVERSSGDERASMCLEDSFKDFEVCRQFDKRHPKVLEYAKKLEGQAQGLGMHAAGVVVSPEPLIDVVPLELRFDSKYHQTDDKASIVTAVDMYGAAAFGLMKIDVLGLRNLDCLKDCKDAIRERHGVEIDLDNWTVKGGDWGPDGIMDPNDKNVLDNFTALRFKGIFQYDTPGNEKICEGVTFESFEDVVAMIALNRPGTARSGLATEYIKRKQDPKARKSIHPVVDAICADTLGVIVYQEHVLKIFTDVAGFSPTSADALRKKIAKKWGDEAIASERANFVNGAVARGFPKELAEDLISKITFFGSYGFNKSHATAYGVIGYQQMWLKTYFPTEFMWSLMANEPDSGEVTSLVKECKKMGINVQPPHVNSSGVRWGFDGADIVGSLTDLKGVGEGAVKAISESRPYADFKDFCARVNRRRCNRKTASVLIQAGSLRGLVSNAKYTFENIETLWDLSAKEKWEAFDSLLAGGDAVPDWSEEEQQFLAAEVNPLAFGKHPVEPYSDLLFKTLGVPFSQMTDEDLFDDPQVFLYGQILEVKYNQIGDFHTGPAPDEEEKKRRKWGARYANLNVEDMTGKQMRVKVDVDIFDDFRHVVDGGKGTVIAISASTNKKFKSLRAHYLVDLGSLRKKLEAINVLDEAEREQHAKDTLTKFERALTREYHPVAPYSMKDVSAITKRVPKGNVTVTGMVTNLNVKLDKKGNEMAFFGLAGVRGHIECLCFASSWSAFSGTLKVGQVVKVNLKRDKSSNILNDDGPDSLVVLED